MTKEYTYYNKSCDHWEYMMFNGTGRHVRNQCDIINCPNFTPAPEAPATVEPTESDPTGLKASEPGAKLDAGKPRADEILRDFSRAIEAVVEIGDEGTKKYSVSGWTQVPDGINRYLNAKKRHELERQKGEVYDKKSGQMHLAHEAWNALAILELTLREAEAKDA